jgi:hypothetical protein
MAKRYQRGNQNPYIEEEQTTQWPKDIKVLAIVLFVLLLAIVLSVLTLTIVLYVFLLAIVMSVLIQ